jgi:hypothetical protein
MSRNITPSSAMQTVKVRAISFDEISALAPHGAEPMKAYKVEDHPEYGQVLLPITLTPEPTHIRDRVPHRAIKALDADPWGNDEARAAEKRGPVGYNVRVRVEDIYGTSTGASLFTSAEAEEVTYEQGGSIRAEWSPSDDRRSIAVEDEAGVELPLLANFGSEAMTTFIVEGMSTTEVAERLENILEAEFGTALRIVKLKTRPVANTRVNVYDSEKNLVATNILRAEVSGLGLNGITVEHASPGMIIGR